MIATQVIWVGEQVTSFAAPCERCRETHEDWPPTITPSVVEGSLRLEADVGFTTCRRGHRIRVRRIARARAAAAG